jgi:hypothetical protein
MKIRLTKAEANRCRELLTVAKQNLGQVEDILGKHMTDQELDSLDGDDPLSNVISAVETTSEALGDIAPDSDWVEIIPAK